MIRPSVSLLPEQHETRQTDTDERHGARLGDLGQIGLNENAEWRAATPGYKKEVTSWS